MIPELLLDPPPPSKPRRGLSVGSIVLLLGVLIVILVVGVQLARRGQTQPYRGIAPDFTLSLYNNAGDFTLSAQRGRIVVVNFWGTWCIPCREEAPELEAIAQQYAAQDVVIVGVNFRDVEPQALAFIAELGLTYPNGIDLGERITTRYNVIAAPETFVIDRKGEVYDFVLGPVTAQSLSAILDRLLADELANQAEAEAGE
ncbi:MAG: TlpA family protein disulfide reductase [Armatimonadetes bacterium]|nr:TlpA family protein disulfide reductase [Anaerolineae bacterium]